MSVRYCLKTTAARLPEAVALQGFGQRLSYRELAFQVSQRVVSWQAAGVRPGDRIAIAATRSVDTIIAILAALEAQAAYVPLDLSYPAERLQAMLADTQARAIVGEPSALAQLQELVGEFPTLGQPALSQPSPFAADGDLVYVLFTSGSTGRPKGVAMGSAPLDHLINWHASHARLGQAARTLQFAPLSFDVHFQEILSSIATGGTLVLIPDAHRRDPVQLRQAMADLRIERLYLPYVALQMLAQADAEATQQGAPALDLRDVVSAGEQLQITPDIRALFARHPLAVLHNHYGPTESHVVTACELSGDAKAWPDIPPIGAPLPHVQVHLRASDDAPAPANKDAEARVDAHIGELLLGGPCLAQGYLGRADLTAERFATDIEGLPGRWYATGDLVKRQSNGELIYLGRVDQQLKVDGFRIEPGDIELALMAQPHIQDAAVSAPVWPHAGRLLTAHLVLRPGAPAEQALTPMLRAWLAERVPDYMVPVRFVVLDKLPTTPSGKIDRRNLPLPERAAAPTGAGAVASQQPPIEQIRALWQDLLGLAQLDDHTNVFDVGARSLLVMRFVSQAKAQGMALAVTDVYDRPTVAGLAQALTAERSSTQTHRPPMAAAHGESMAIIGMALRADNAHDLDTFWANLLNNREGVRRFAPHEIDPAVPASLRERPNFVAARGVLDDADRFDAAFFGISAREATMLDPQQRLFLELCWSALEDAAVDPASGDQRIGVYAGSANNTYLPAMRAEQPELIAQYGEFATMLANEKDYVATRTAHRLNLRGPAVSIHTACSTSLVAVAQAWHALAHGQCDVALAGGVTLVVPQAGGHLHVEGGMESADGRCCPFDAQASGTLFASGGGVVVLKRLSQALADGDPVYAVIKGVGLNNDGGDKASFTAPSVSGQADVIRMALDHAGVNARSIGYVEAHGTGTALGDPIEVAALSRAWAEDTGDTAYCRLGSVKGHLGHMVAAAGVMGLIKATLALHREQVPGTLNFRQPNPQIDFATTPFVVDAQAHPWPRGPSVRRAAVSSFGVGGTNAHVILEEAPVATVSRDGHQEAQRLWLLPLSARSEEAAIQRAQDLANWLSRNPDQPLSQVAQTLMRGRQAMPTRLAVVAQDAAGAIAALQAAKVTHTSKRQPRVVFVFPGQGSQHPGMARGLIDELPAFRAAFDEGLAAAPPALAATLRQLLIDAAPDDTDAAASLAETRHAQPALLLMSWSLGAWLDSLGIVPQAMIGHSVGEYTAACRAGVMSLAQAMSAVIERGQAMFEQPTGAMLAVRASADATAALLPAGVDIAAVNAPQLTVVAGPHALIDELAQNLTAQDIASTRLKVSHGFHSAAMDGALPRVAAALSRITLNAPQATLYSCISGEPLGVQATDPHYWASQVRAPVAFSRAVQSELGQGDVLFVEVGPSQALSALIRQHRLPNGSVPRTVSLLGTPQAAQAQPAAQTHHALNALAHIWSLGVNVSWPVPAQTPRLPLPGYPFKGPRYWFARSAPAAAALEATFPHIAHAVSPPSSPAPAMSRLPRLEQELTRILNDVAGIPPDEVDRDATFVDQGLDSLSLTQATLEFEKVFGIKMRFRRLLEDLDTLGKLASFLDSELPADRFAPPPAAPAVPAVLTAPHAPSALAPVAAGPLTQITQLASFAPAGDALHQLIQQQMQLMSQQLALLSGQPQPMAAQQSAPALASPGVANVAAATGSSTSGVIGKQPAPGADADQPSKMSLLEKPFGASARITLTASTDFTPAQRQWLDDFVARYNARTGGSKRFSQAHRQVMADPRVVTGFNPLWKDLVYPIVADRSKGAHVWDIDGNEYIDLLSCFGANLLGYQPDSVKQAMVDQLEAGIEVGPQHPVAAEVARLIAEFTGMERVAFCNTGSEAVMGAMRIARTVTGRKTIAIFTNSYHGIFDEVIVRGTRQLRSLSAAPGILANAVENVLVLDYDSPDSLKVLRERGPELAAIMIEPIQNKYPTLQPRAFVQSLREIADQAGCALIFDEVVTGFRVAPGGAQEFYGVRADMATYGKIIGGGLPFAAIAGAAPWLDALDGGYWQYGDESYPEAGVTYFAGTFVRHPLALAAARATLLHLKQSGHALYRKLNGRTQHLVDSLNAAFAARRAPVKAVHCASLWRLAWDDNLKHVSLFYYLARFHGLHLYEQFGHFVTEAMSEADAARIVTVFTQALDELMALGFIEPRDAPTGGGSGGSGGSDGQLPGGAGHNNGNSPKLASAGLGGDLANSSSSASARHAARSPGSQAALTPGQTERWLAAAFDPAARRALNESFCVSLSGAVDRPALKAALDDVLGRHEAFKLRFDLDEPHQILSDGGLPAVTELDLSAHADAERALEDFCVQASRRDFPLDQAPLAAASLLSLADGRTVVHLVASHLVFDGWASSVFNTELAQAYAARRLGLPPDLPAAESPLDFADAEQARFDSPDGREALAYWQALLQQPPALLALGDRSPAKPRTFAGDTVRARIDGPQAQALRQSARQAGATLFQILLTAVTAMLRQQGQQSEFVVSVPYAAQALAQHGPLMADGVLDLPLRLACEPDESGRAVLARVRSQLMDALEHPLMTQGTVARALGIRSSGDRPPLTGIYFNLNPKVDLSHYPGLQASMVEGRKQGLLSELFFNFYDQGDAITLDLHHSAEFFSLARAGELVQALMAQCQLLAQDLDQPLSAQPGAAAPAQAAASPLAPTPSPSQAKAKADARIAAWNAATALPLEPRARIEQWVSQQAARTPQAAALVAVGQALSYAQLQARANQFAQVLRARGAGPNTLVGICLSRGPELVPALLGILQTGAAYVPLDPGFPKERLRYMAEDAQLRLVISESAHQGLSGLPRSQQLLIDEDAQLINAASAAALPLDASWPADAPAYVIYTSGSTGQPKGVVLPQNAVCNFLLGMQKEPGLHPADSLLAVTTLSFDIAVLELFLPLVVGAKVVLAQREQAMDGDVLGRFIAEQQIKVMQATPTTWHMLLDAGWRAPAGFKALCGGEPLPPSLAARLLASGIELWNMYGPTETTVWSTLSRIQQAGRITVGHPIANTQVWILDEQGQPCAIGQEGELCIGGAGIAMGYLNRPELTAEKFVPDPFSTQAKARLYRTGDLARWADDGQIEHLGRLDFQVKIRGYRIELGEIEARLDAQAGISRSVVVAREDTPGDVRLVAYVVPNGVPNPSQAVDATALRDALRIELPDYMVPQAIVTLDALPLLPNGKIDRKALPAPTIAPASQSPTSTPPSSAVEKLVAKAMQAVLKCGDLGLEDDFFSMGGHSILAAKLIAQLNRELGLQISLRTLFESPTVGKLAAALSQLKDGDTPVARAPIVRRPDRTSAPLTLMQQRVNFIEEIHPGRVIYHAPTGHRLRGPINLDAFNRAFQEMVRRQDVFRTSIVRRDGEWVQHIDEHLELSLLPLEDLSHLPEDEREKTLLRRMNELVATTFQLGRAPLVSTHLFKLADEHHAMFLMPHHIIWDGWSFDVIYLELPPLYEAFLAGKPSPLPELPVTYGDFAAWHNEWIKSDEIRQQLGFWERQMRTCPPQRAPFTDRPRDQLAAGNGATEFMMIPQDKAEQLRAIARQTGTTVSIIILATYAALMSQWIRDPAPAIGLPVRGRPSPELEGVMGFFNNMLPLRLTVQPELSCLDWVRAVKRLVTDALAHQDVPFEMVAQHLKLKAGNLYQVLFNYQDVRDRQLSWGSLKHERINLMQDGATEDMNLWIVEGLAGIGGGVQYDADMFLPSTARAIRDRFLALIDRLIAQPEQSVDALLTMRPDDQQVCAQWGATLTAASKPLDLFERLDELAAQSGNETALRMGTLSLSRTELQARVNHFVPALQSCLSAERQTVAIAVADPIAHLVASLAALRAGAQCLNLAPGLSAADLDRADLAACVCEDAVSIAMPAGVHRIDSMQVPGARAGSLPQGLSSGATGQQRLPLSRAALSDTCSALQGLLGLQAGERMLAIDTGDRAWLVGQAAIALSNGTALLIGQAELVQQPTALSQLITQERISLLHLARQDWLSLLATRQGQGQKLALQALIDVTESDTGLVNALLGADSRVLSVYRPSAWGLPVAAASITQDRDTAVFGHPLLADQVDIIDEQGRSVPAHAPGELVLKAPGHSPLLRSGSLVRWRSDGVLQYLGETGRTCYLNGHRIDLQAIERCLFAHPDVARVIAAVRTQASGERTLVAYVQASSQPASEAALKQLLLAELPADQLPSAFIHIHAVPTLPNGELNIDALPMPPTAAMAQSQRSASGSSGSSGGARALSDAERKLADIWQRLLDVADVRATDNFFDLGGNSLLAMRAAEEARTALGLEIAPPRYVFETLAQLVLPPTVAPAQQSTAMPAPSDLPPAKGPGLLGRMWGAWSGKAD